MEEGALSPDRQRRKREALEEDHAASGTATATGTSPTPGRLRLAADRRRRIMRESQAVLPRFEMEPYGPISTREPVPAGRRPAPGDRELGGWPGSGQEPSDAP